MSHCMSRKLRLCAAKAVRMAWGSSLHDVSILRERLFRDIENQSPESTDVNKGLVYAWATNLYDFIHSLVRNTQHGIRSIQPRGKDLLGCFVPVVSHFPGLYQGIH